MTDKLRFPSEEWVKEYCSRLSNSSEYNRLGRGWKDAIQFKIADIDNLHTYPGFRSFTLSLNDGKCDGYRLIKDESDDAPFVLNSSYSNWKKILEGMVNPTQAMLSGILKVKGDMMTLMKYAAAATEMVNVAGTIETEF